MKQRIQNMEGKKLSKKSKNLKKSASEVPEVKAKVSENGKVSKKAATKKAKLSVTPNSDGSKNKKAAKLVEMIQGPEATENVVFVPSAPNAKGSGNKKKKNKKAVVEEPKVDQAVEADNKKKKAPKKGKSDGDKVVVEPTEINVKTEKGVTETDLKKIEKKKAKKAAQKLKKAQKKSMKSTEPKEATSAEATTPKKPKEKPKKASKKAVKKTKVNGDSNDGTSVVKPENGDTTNATPTKDAVSERVLIKKERKNKKRQLLKEQRLEGKGTMPFISKNTSQCL